jgi:hypothetical protein
MLLMETVLNHRIELEGKPVDITLSEAARDALSRRTKPLAVEMELYFSCLIRKQVRFRDAGQNDPHGAELNDRLRIHFRPVMTRACGKDYEGDEPPLTDFPLARRRPYIPHWLRIDFHNGQWHGEFGYSGKH